ncbi:MAG: penicillin-binding protein 2 [Mariprofundaceae bacterium]
MFTSQHLNSRNRFDRKIVAFMLLFAILQLLILFRLVDLQWLRHNTFSLQADQNRINVIPLLPMRGEIVDRKGQALAMNHISYYVQMIPERVDQLDLTLVTLSKILQWDAEQQVKVRKKITTARSDRPLHIADNLSWDQVAPLTVHLHRLPGVDVQAGTTRFYPNGSLTAHLVGYLSMVNSHDLQRGFLPVELVGRAGAEAVFESMLHGEIGHQQEEVNALGHRVGVMGRSPPQSGKRIELSIDIDIQQAAATALGERTGAVIVMDVESGEILTLLSQPSYDPNYFINGLSMDRWQSWLKNEDRPLHNRTSQAAYPPASTFKLITSFAGLRHREPLAASSLQCSGHLELADRKLRCWKRKGHQHTDLHRALVESCDVYFYTLGDQLGRKKLLDEARMWGFGKATGFALQPEAVGHLSQRRGGKWTRGETMIAAIGQGSITVTPLQLTRFFAAIANGGALLRPQIMHGEKRQVDHQVDVNPMHLQRIQHALRDVVASPRGTAHSTLAKLDVAVAGKTGTAQVIAMAQNDEEQPQSHTKKHLDHAWFAGFAPYDKPKIAMVVFVEHGGHGGSAAGPVAAAVVRAWAKNRESQ